MQAGNILDALLAMAPQRIVDAEQTAYEMRDLVARMKPADAAALASELANCRALADSAAALLLQLLEISAGSNPAYTGYGVPAALPCGPAIRA
jgi:hypothetical protein